MIDILRAENETAIERKEKRAEGSYTCYLFDQGIDKILKNCGEECSVVIIAAKNGIIEDTVGELSDLIYHLSVLMANEGITVDDLEAEYLKRHAKENNLKVFHKVDKNT